MKDFNKLSKGVQDALKESGYTEEYFEDLGAFEIFNLFLEFNGIFGYTTIIIEAIKSILEYDKEEG